MDAYYTWCPGTKWCYPSKNDSWPFGTTCKFHFSVKSELLIDSTILIVTEKSFLRSGKFSRDIAYRRQNMPSNFLGAIRRHKVLFDEYNFRGYSQLRFTELTQLLTVNLKNKLDIPVSFKHFYCSPSVTFGAVRQDKIIGCIPTRGVWTRPATRLTYEWGWLLPLGFWGERTRVRTIDLPKTIARGSCHEETQSETEKVHVFTPRSRTFDVHKQ